MDAFGDDPAVDPAAEFLARERADLAGLDIINGTGAEENPANLESSGSFEMINSEINNEINNEQPSENGFGGAVPRPVHEVPERIKKWREEQAARLDEKDLEEEKAKAELREQAKKELEDWKKRHDETISKTKSTNRNAEKQFVAEKDEIIEGTEWERIAKLCEFNQANQALKLSKSNKDNSRMRSIILQLKQSPVTIKKA